MFGAICAIGTTLLSSSLLYTEEGRGPKEERGRKWLTALPWWRMAGYIPWLALEIIKANLLMVPMILGSRSRLRPRMVTVNCGLRREVTRAALGNSITMTPGTLTVDVSEDGEYLVHAVDSNSEQGLLSRRMEKKVAWALGDEFQEDPENEKRAEIRQGEDHR